MAAYRTDAARGLRLRSMEMDPDTGFLRITGVVAAPGEQDYPEFGFTEKIGTTVLADEEANETLRGKPVVVLHPDVEEHGGKVDLSNVRTLRVGTVLTVEWDAASEELLYEAQIEDADAIEKLLDAKENPDKPGALRDVSPGYELVEKRGDEQIKRSYNHLALVPRGRGERARVHLDAMPEPEPPVQEKPKGEIQMEKEELIELLDAYREDMKSMVQDAMSGVREDMASMREDMEDKEKPREDEDEKMDEKERMDALNALTEERRGIVEIAKRVDVAFRADADNLANMRAILEKKAPKAYRADAGDDAVRGMFSLFASGLADAKPAEKPADDTETRFDGFGYFAPAPAPAQRNDAVGDDPFEAAARELAEARASRH